MALAETGRFEEAIALQRRLVEAAEREGRSRALERLERRLRAYEAGEPVRAPWTHRG